LDIADYLLRFNNKEFIESKPVKTITIIDMPKATKPVEVLTGFSKLSKPVQESWLTEIESIEHFFNTVRLPEAPIKLNPSQRLFVYEWVIKYLNNSVFGEQGKEDIKLTDIQNLLTSQMEQLKAESQ
jgi:hypothetical protein